MPRHPGRNKTLMKDRPIIVHSLKDAQAAMAVADMLGVPVTLRSAPGAARYLGAQVFRDMIAEAARQYPGLDVTPVFDCGNDPGLVLGALRHGLKVIRTAVNGEPLDRLKDIAAQSGAKLEMVGRNGNSNGNEAVLDLLDLDDQEAAVRNWLVDER